MGIISFENCPLFFSTGSCMPGQYAMWRSLMDRSIAGWSPIPCLGWSLLNKLQTWPSKIIQTCLEFHLKLKGQWARRFSFYKGHLIGKSEVNEKLWKGAKGKTMGNGGCSLHGLHAGTSRHQMAQWSLLCVILSCTFNCPRSVIYM